MAYDHWDVYSLRAINRNSIYCLSIGPEFPNKLKHKSYKDATQDTRPASQPVKAVEKPSSPCTCYSSFVISTGSRVYVELDVLEHHTSPQSNINCRQNEDKELGDVAMNKGFDA